MSRWIRLSDSRGRDARVRMEATSYVKSNCFQSVENHPVKAEKLIKSPIDRSFEQIRSQCADDNEFAKMLIQGDPEIDMEAAGRKTGKTDRILLDPDGNVLYAASEVEILYDSMGYEIERREPVMTASNINAETPLAWTGKMFRRSEAVSCFAFTRNYQLRHVDGLTFDFLFAMASELDRLDSVVLIGIGSRGADPIILERNGLPYRGFLEGRINGDKYLLLLHLSRLELLQPAEVNL